MEELDFFALNTKKGLGYCVRFMTELFKNNLDVISFFKYMHWLYLSSICCNFNCLTSYMSVHIINEL